MNSPQSNATEFGPILQAALQRSQAPTAILNNDVIIYSNDAFMALCGDMIDKPCYSIFTENHADQLQWLLRSQSLESEKIILSLNGQSSGQSVLVQYEPLDGNIALLSLLTEYSHNRLADIDELTELPNRRRAVLMLEVATSRLRRSPNSHFCVALGDIDHFKQVNDTYGHDVGDDVLRYVARAIQSALRDNDWTARWGGEEFIFYIDEADLTTGIQPLERIRQAIAAIEVPDYPDLNISMSFGVVSSGEATVGDAKKSIDMQTIINKSDILLYEAKVNGRNRVEWDKKETTVWVKDSILNAIDNKDIVPLMYPIVDFQGNVVMYKIFHGIKDKDASDTTKLLFAANRLAIRGYLDYFLLQSIDFNQLATMKENVVFPVSPSLCQSHMDELLEVINQYPNFSVGIYSCDAFPNVELNTILNNSKNITLSNVHARNMPLDLIVSDTVTNIIFRHPEMVSAQLISNIQDKTNTYAMFVNNNIAGSCMPSEDDIKNIKELGFNGYFSGAHL